MLMSEFMPEDVKEATVSAVSENIMKARIEAISNMVSTLTVEVEDLRKELDWKKCEPLWNALHQAWMAMYSADDQLEKARQICQTL